VFNVSKTPEKKKKLGKVKKAGYGGGGLASRGKRSDRNNGPHWKLLINKKNSRPKKEV